MNNQLKKLTTMLKSNMTNMATQCFVKKFYDQKTAKIPGV